MKTRNRWSRRAGLVRAAQLLGIAELLGGLAILIFRHDGAQGFALLAIGAGTFGSMPWVLGRQDR